LRRVIETLCTISTPPEEEIAANDTDENSDPKGNILIVDDSSENLHFLTDILTQHGHKVRRVTDGKMALKLIRDRLPNIILLDITTQYGLVKSDPP
jgi:PleD family two-component response regulator